MKQTPTLKRFVFFSFILSCFPFLLFAQDQTGQIHGKISSENGFRVAHVEVLLENTPYKTFTNTEGRFTIDDVPYGTYQLVFKIDDKVQSSEALEINSNYTKIEKSFHLPGTVMRSMSVFGNKQTLAKKLDNINKLPISPEDQVQNIFVIDEELLKDQGALNVAEAAQNVSGVYTFATYGGVKQSMSIRGFRGVPILKNGVLISSDKGGRGFATDFEGVEAVQVIKGANSVNLGAATSYGNAGGMINLVTKTPHFVNRGNVGIRVASFGMIRPTFDVETLLGKKNRSAFRINGAYENRRTYQNIAGIGKETFYINPSLAFRPDEHTEIILETDYYNDVQSFDPGTINLSLDNTQNELYKLPKDRFLGFKGNDISQKLFTASARARREINPHLFLRGAAMFSNYDTRGASSILDALPTDSAENINVNDLTVYRRSLERHKEHTDKNFVAQFDLVGDHIKTGIFTHTFVAGVDFRTYNVEERKFNSMLVDTIDVTKPVNNEMPAGVPDFVQKSTTNTTTVSSGFTLQDAIEIGDRIRVIGGVRFGTTSSTTKLSSQAVRGNYVNPFVGGMVRLVDDIHLFADYTNTSDPQNAQFRDKEGNPLGAETFQQVEVGLKGTWFDKKLRANATYYRTINNGMNMQAAIKNENTGAVELQDYYFKGGKARYEGFELDVIGKITDNLFISAGFAKMVAVYDESTEFWKGSSVKNVPNYTINAYLNYAFSPTSTLKGLSLGAGYYYTGKRTYNDWTNYGVDYHGIVPGLEPWDVKAYYTVNAQINYDFQYLKTPVLNRFNTRLLLNNLTNSLGYNAYRLVNVNRIDPINWALEISYHF